MTRSRRPPWVAPRVIDPILALVERIDRRLRRINPVRDGSILGIERTRHRGPDVTLADGTAVGDGSPLWTIHFDNARLRELAARWVADACLRGGRCRPARDRRTRCVASPVDARPVALCGVTLLAPLTRRVGFELRDRKRTAWVRPGGLVPAVAAGTLVPGGKEPAETWARGAAHPGSLAVGRRAAAALRIAASAVGPVPADADVPQDPAPQHADHAQPQRPAVEAARRGDDPLVGDVPDLHAGALGSDQQVQVLGLAAAPRRSRRAARRGRARTTACLRAPASARFPYSRTQKRARSTGSRVSGRSRMLAARSPASARRAMVVSRPGDISESASMKTRRRPRASRAPRFLARAMPGGTSPTTVTRGPPAAGDPRGLRLGDLHGAVRRAVADHDGLDQGRVHLLRRHRAQRGADQSLLVAGWEDDRDQRLRHPAVPRRWRCRAAVASVAMPASTRAQSAAATGALRVQEDAVQPACRAAAAMGATGPPHRAGPAPPGAVRLPCSRSVAARSTGCAARSCRPAQGDLVAEPGGAQRAGQG